MSGAWQCPLPLPGAWQAAEAGRPPPRLTTAPFAPPASLLPGTLALTMPSRSALLTGPLRSPTGPSWPAYIFLCGFCCCLWFFIYLHDLSVSFSL